MDAGEPPAGSGKRCVTCQRVMPAQLRYCPACGTDVRSAPASAYDELPSHVPAPTNAMKSPITTPLVALPMPMSGRPAVLRHQKVMLGIGSVALVLALIVTVVNFNLLPSGERAAGFVGQVAPPRPLAAAATRQPFASQTTSAATALLPAAVSASTPAPAPLPDMTLLAPGPARLGSETPLPDQTATESVYPTARVNVERLNIRAGPGASHAIVGLALKGQVYRIVGRNSRGDWWQVCCVEGDKEGWVLAEMVTVEKSGAVEAIPITEGR